MRVTGHIWGHDDVYRQPVGIRTVEWTNSTVLINGKPIYIRGFGKHEDGNVSVSIAFPTISFSGRYVIKCNSMNSFATRSVARAWTTRRW